MNSIDGQLQLQGVCAGYGQTMVLENITFGLSRGEAISILGRNGVGKSTLLETIMGHTSLHQGSIHLGNTDLAPLRSFRRVWAGLGYVPQEREIFPSLTVMENLAIAGGRKSDALDSVFDLFPQLKARMSNMGNQLSGGEQQMLAIARALLGKPTVLLMDEPSEGLAPVIVDELQKALVRVREEHAMAIILVEQNSRVALEFADRCLVMNRGRIVRDGSSIELRDDPQKLDQLIGVDIS